MKDWYQNRMESGINHRGFNVPQDKFLYLTEAQAKGHNKEGTERVAKLDRVPKKEEVAVLADWNEYEQSLKADGRGLGGSPHERPVQEADAKPDIKEGEITTEKEAAPTKANRRNKQ